MKIQMKGISLMIILLMLALTVQAAVLRGTITDKAVSYTHLDVYKRQVIRRIRALSGFIGFKGSVAGCLSQL